MEDIFKQVFKYYKANKPLPSMDKVLIIDKNKEHVDRVSSCLKFNFLRRTNHEVTD